ncbi:MAG: sialate O-acetylesterase [Planctomycetota bacterium]
MKKMMILLVAVVVAVACLRAEGGDWYIPTEKAKFHIFLLMGQSNMAGGIKGDHLTDEDKTPVPHIVYIPTLARRFNWKPAAHPLHVRHNRPKSFGSGLPFAKEYLKNHPGVTVGLIPVAKGGARIDILKKGSNIYEDAIKKARFAAEKGTIKGVLWHQGESDCRLERRVSYENKLHQLIADIRTDLQIKDLPFIVGNLPEFRVIGKQPEAIKGIKEIMAILRRVPEKVKNTGFVETTGLTACDAPKYSHFDRKSYITLGKRYFEAYKKTIQNKDNQTEDNRESKAEK